MNKFNGVFYLTMQRYSIWCLKYALVLFKNVMDLFLLSGDALVGELTCCYSIVGMLRIYHD